MDNSDQIIWMFPIAIVMMAIGAVLSAGGGETGLRRWAAAENLRLLSIERRRFDKGPFLFRTGKNGKVYYFLASDADDRQRRGFARVKPPMGCLFCDPVTIEWEDNQWQ